MRARILVAVFLCVILAQVSPNPKAEYTLRVRAEHISNMRRKKHICQRLQCPPTLRTQYKFAQYKTTVELGVGLLIVEPCLKNKTLLMIREMNPEKNIWNLCCSQGMVPGIIKTREELNCVFSVYKNYTDSNFSPRHIFYTGFTDHTLNQDFRSCPDLLPVPPSLWAENQPDNAGGEQNVLALDLSGLKRTLGFFDATSAVPENLMCQYEERLNNSGRCAERDCACASSDVMSVKRRDFVSILESVNKIQKLIRKKKSNRKN